MPFSHALTAAAQAAGSTAKPALQAAKRSVRYSGWELTGPPGRFSPYRLRRMDLAAFEGVVQIAGDQQHFSVPLDRCSTAVGFSYAPGGWHPYVATLQAVRDRKVWRYRESPLAELHEAYQPATLQEALFEDAGEPMWPLDEWSPHLATWVWGLGRRHARAATEGDHERFADFDNLYMGPRTPAEGVGNFAALLALYRAIASSGYRPLEHSFVEGYFLADGEDYRFMVTDGQHRLAVLRVLGVANVVVRLWGGPAVVAREHLTRWTTDAYGFFPPPVAEAVFDRMLAEDGDRKARALGLTTLAVGS